MTEQELNSYRFGSGADPTDEMLAAIMKEAARDAAESNRKATEALYDRMRRRVQEIDAWLNASSSNG